MDYKKKRTIVKILLLSFVVIIMVCPKGLFGQTPTFINPTEGTVTHEKHGPNTNCSVHVNNAHDGMDVANAEGTPIIAVANGTIAGGGSSTTGGGNWITLDYGNGFRTSYQHLQGFHRSLLDNNDNLVIGQRVTRGQQIGTMGHTGNVTV